MVSFALTLRGLYSSFVVVLHLLRQLLLAGIVQGKLDKIGDEVLSTLIILNFCSHSLESLINSQCQLDYLSHQVSPCRVNDGSPRAEPKDCDECSRATSIH